MILFTGNGKSGSWKIRGLQLGSAVGGVISPQCTNLQQNNVNLVVMVKKEVPGVVQECRKNNIPWVWDVVDGWPQPSGNQWDKDTAVKWLKEAIARLQPTAMVFPTKAMAEDAEFKGRWLVLPHHAWGKYEKVKHHPTNVVVGYEGGPHYIQPWVKQITEECNRRKWTFLNNGDMQKCHIGLALRGFSGHPARNWKSNVKLANIQGLGIPAICSNEAGYREYMSGVEFFVEDAHQLSHAFSQLEDFERRRIIGHMMHERKITLASIALRYRLWLDQLSS